MEFEEYAAAQLRALARYATRLVGDAHRAEDVVQGALIRTASHWRRVSAMDRPDLYLRKAILHEHISTQRRRWARSVVLTRDVPEPSPATDPATSSADRDEMWGRLQALPPRQRAVLVLRYYEDLSDHEIARVLDCSAATVRSHASHALAALRDRMPATPRKTTR